MPSRPCPDPSAMLFGERIRQLRMEKEMSLLALAHASGVSKGHLSDLEAGKVVATIGTVARVAVALEVPPFVLFMYPGDDPWVEVIEHLRVVSGGDWKKAAEELRRLAFETGINLESSPNDAGS